MISDFSVVATTDLQVTMTKTYSKKKNHYNIQTNNFSELGKHLNYYLYSHNLTHSVQSIFCLKLLNKSSILNGTQLVIYDIMYQEQMRKNHQGIYFWYEL